MFFFGHLGIGSKMASHWAKGLSRTALLVGTVLPDLIDKPLYYGNALLIGHEAAKETFISGTRTFGHTAIFFLVLTLVAQTKRSRLFAAVSLGVATHLLIDNVGDQVQRAIGLTEPFSGPTGIHALLWPLMGWRFPVFGYSSAMSHFARVIDPWILGGEIAGSCILAWDYLRGKRDAGRHRLAPAGIEEN